MDVLSLWVMGDGSSPINENTCHGIDTVRYVLGPVDRIYAEADNFIGQGPKTVPDAAAFTMHHKTGAISTVVGGACAPYPASGAGPCRLWPCPARAASTSCRRATWPT